MKHVPNILTFIRLCLVPVFPILYFSSMQNAHTYALLIYLVAGVTDFLDGYLARKFQVISTFGIIIDPLADKLMLLTALSCLYISAYIPLYVLIIVLVKEVSMVICGMVLYLRKTKTIIPSNMFGKVASVIFNVTIFLLILLPYHPLTISCLVIAIILEFIALSSYVRHYFKNLK